MSSPPISSPLNAGSSRSRIRHHEVSSMDKEGLEIFLKESKVRKRRQENVVNGWAKLDTDILLRIIQKHFSLLEFSNSGLAHVCKDWRAVCCDPVLWATLKLSNPKSVAIPIFGFLEPPSYEVLTRILKLSMSLSKGNTRTLICHFNLRWKDHMFTYTVKRCPNLRRLVLPMAWLCIFDTTISKVLPYCKHLESLTMSSNNPRSVFSSIVKKSKLRELKVIGPIYLFFAQSLVQHLTKLKVLSLRCTSIERDALLIILEKLKSLEILNISHSYLVVRQQQQPNKDPKTIIVRELDEMIMEKASKLKSFVTCMKYQTCALCHWTEVNRGILLEHNYHEGVWKDDEVSSLQI